eukprot:5211132-Prymnesium_polylepis.1
MAVADHNVVYDGGQSGVSAVPFLFMQHLYGHVREVCCQPRAGSLGVRLIESKMLEVDPPPPPPPEPAAPPEKKGCWHCLCCVKSATADASKDASKGEPPPRRRASAVESSRGERPVRR